MKFPAILLFSLILLSSCSTPTTDATNAIVLDPLAYEQFLTTSSRPSLTKAQEQLAFWNARITQDSSGIGDLGPTAAAYQNIFAQTGDATLLRKAEKLYKKALTTSAHNKDNYARSLAALYITQHKFKKADSLMLSLTGIPSNKIETDYVMFDILMELGEYQKAGDHLFAQIDKSKFNYLIRRAKWEDYRGNLDQAIHHLELAKDIAESANDKQLKVWTYTNIADFYGHAGQIKASRDHYLKALSLEPDNSYSMKGLAWIAYSNDNNPMEANRILDSLLVVHDIPDYYLLKAEIAEVLGNKAEAEKLISTFIKKAEAPRYGGMYNTYLIEIFAESKPKKALVLAQRELQNRDTPETRQLLALAQMKNGQLKEARSTIETYVVDKTYEPTAALRIAEVYEALGEEKLSEKYYASIADARYELGPVTFSKIPTLKG